MPVITPWLPEHEVPQGTLDNNLVRAWAKHELIAKHCHLYREIKQMIGELIALLKQERLSCEFFDTYTKRIQKGLPKTAMPDDKKRINLVNAAKVEVKQYRAFHKQKMERFTKMKQCLKMYLREWQVLRTEVKDQLASDYNWEKSDIPNKVTVQMHFSHPKWEKCNRCLIEQMQQKYDYARARFENDDECNAWILASEQRMSKNLLQGSANNIDEVIEAQDNHFGPEMSNFAMSHQVGNTVSYTEIGDDGLPIDMHFDVVNIDVDAADFLDMF